MARLKRTPDGWEEGRTLRPTSLKIGIMRRMWVIEKTGLRSLRCLRWWSPVARMVRKAIMIAYMRNIRVLTKGSEQSRTEIEQV